MMDIRKFNYDGRLITVEFSDGQKLVNATEMAKPFAKRPADFLRNKGTQAFILALQHTRETRGETGEVLRIVRQGDKSLRGTWLNEPLALKFAAWLAPAFEVWIYERIHQLLTSGETELAGEVEGYTFQLRQMAEQLAEREAAEIVINKRLDKLEETQLSERGDYFTISGYCRLHKIDCPLEKARKWGAIAKRKSEQEKVAMGSVHDARYGRVRTYRGDILEQVILRKDK